MFSTRRKEILWLQGLLLTIAAVACSSVTATGHCRYTLRPGSSLGFTATKESAGITYLEPLSVANVQDCKMKCCVDEKCNTMVYQHYRGIIPEGAKNCFLVHCDETTGCQAENREDFFLYTLDPSLISIPVVDEIEPQTARTVSQTTAIVPQSKVLPTFYPSTAITVQYSNATQAVTEVIATTPSGPTALSASQALSPALETLIPAASTSATAVSSRVTSIAYSYSQVTNGTYETSDQLNATSSRTKHVKGIQHAYGILISIAVLGLVLMLASLYIMWKSHREVRYRKYKEIIFLLHDEDVLYA